MPGSVPRKSTRLLSKATACPRGNSLDLQHDGVLRDKFLLDAKPLNKVSGQPFKIQEILDAIRAEASN
eukprot:GDKH01021601.1.p1 GENE.GDKH01021601.1~~GDKH01021601.1.p1  ORF type:complete len:68 (-),score=3.14 GDKH01021601.1:50-253(-)